MLFTIIKAEKVFYLCDFLIGMYRCQKPGEKNIIKKNEGFPGGAVVKNPPANARDMGSRPGPGRSHMLRSN